MDILTNLIGVYSPLKDSLGNYVGGLAGVDYFYLMKCAFVLILLYGTVQAFLVVIRGLFR